MGQLHPADGRDRAARKHHHGRDRRHGTPSSLTTYILRLYTETRATLVQLFDIVWAVCTFRVFPERMRHILLTVTQEQTLWRNARRPWKHLVFGTDLNVQMPGGLDGITGPRVHRDAYEQSEQHREHMEEILQFMSEWKLAATQLWTWTQLKADEEGTGAWSGEEGSSATPTGLFPGYPNFASSSLGTPKTAGSVITSR